VAHPPSRSPKTGLTPRAAALARYPVEEIFDARLEAQLQRLGAVQGRGQTSLSKEADEGDESEGDDEGEDMMLEGMEDEQDDVELQEEQAHHPAVQAPVSLPPNYGWRPGPLEALPLGNR
jgi:hypothetical protein